MLDFKCVNCNNQIQADSQYVGETVKCPLCGYVQIVPDPPLLPNTEYYGYKIEELISASLLWITYKARGSSELSGKKVTLKIPTTFFKANVSDIVQFSERVAAAGFLNIKEIPMLLDRCVTTEKTFFVFERMDESLNLSTFLTGEPLDQIFALKITRNIAIALKKANEKANLKHYNLEVENINVNPKEQVQIENLGISEFLLSDSQLISNGFNIWNYKYMPPEFMKLGETSFPGTDIYSLGGILFVLLTGHEPYEDLSLEERIQAHTPNPLVFNPQLHPTVLSLFQKLMANQPELRFPTWDKVIESIDYTLTKIDIPADSEGISRILAKSKKIQKDLSTETVGLSLEPADSSKKVKNKSVKQSKQKKQSEYNSTDTVAQPVPKVKKPAKTIKKKIEKNKKRERGIHKRIPSSKTKNYTPQIIIISILFVTFLIIGLLIAMKSKYKHDKTRILSEKLGKVSPVESNRNKIASRASTPNHSTIKNISTPQNSSEDNRSSRKKIPPLYKEFAEIGEYVRKHPDKLATVIAKYESLQDKAIAIGDVKMAGIIKTRLLRLYKQQKQQKKNGSTVEKRNTQSANLPAKKTDKSKLKQSDENTPESHTPSPKQNQKPHEIKNKKSLSEAQLLCELKKIEKEITDNPKDYEGAISKLEKLQNKAIEQKATAIVDIIRKEIIDIEDAQEAEVEIQIKRTKSQQTNSNW